MTTKEEIVNTLKRLNRAIAVKVPIIIDTTAKCIQSLLETLEKEDVILTIKKYHNSKLVRVQRNINAVEVLEKFVTTKKNNISCWCQKLLADGKGTLIISTSKGIMSDKEATQKQLGGLIIGFIN